MTTLPYLDCYWVLPNHFLAGAYPGGYDDESTRKTIQSLIHAGIDCIIDLTQPGDSFFPYAEVLKEEAADFEVKVERFNFPIPDFDVPSINLMKKILDTIDGKLESGHNVYVHCIGGIGRTGTTVACHLIRHGLSGEEALAELQSLRQNSASWYRRSPESDEQIEFVRNWKTGQ